MNLLKKFGLIWLFESRKDATKNWKEKQEKQKNEAVERDGEQCNVLYTDFEEACYLIKKAKNEIGKLKNQIENIRN